MWKQLTNSQVMNTVSENHLFNHRKMRNDFFADSFGRYIKS